MSWALHQSGLFERRAAVGKLPEARYAVVLNIEVYSRLAFVACNEEAFTEKWCRRLRLESCHEWQIG